MNAAYATEAFTYEEGEEWLLGRRGMLDDDDKIRFI
jgi:hypothetical protein